MRKRWPADVATLLKGEFTRSTAEADRKLAEAKVPAIAAEYHAKVAEARRRLADNRYRDLSQAEIERLAAKFFTEALPRYQVKGPLSPAEREALLRDTEEQVRRLAAQVGARDPTVVASLTRNLVEREGLPIPEDSPSLHTLQLLVLRAFAELHRNVVAQLGGEADYRPADKDVAKLIDAEGKPKRSVRDLLDAYEDEKQHGWSASTRSAFEPVRRLLEDTIGDREAASITREDARQVQALLRQLPRNLGKMKQLAGLKVPQAIELGRKLGLPTISPNTINRGYLVHIAGAFNFARREQWIAANPFEGLSAHDPIPAADKRDPFTAEQLTALFGWSPWMPRDDSKPGRFWVPLLCAFQGLRLGEAAGLLVEHVTTREGVPVLMLRAYEGHRLKTASSRGVLPVHAELIRMGFLEFVQAARSSGAERLFPDAKVNANGKGGAKLGEWFSRRVRELGLEGRKLGMHSFRHAFEDRLREAELPERTALALARRAERGSSGSYGHGLSIKALSAAMQKITYPGLDLSHLYREER